jgi:hypothetical protein
VTPLLFDAQVAPPEEAFLDQAIIEELGQILEEQLPPSTIPVSIRWRLKPEAGLPNGPFRVWRRKGDDPLDMIPLPVNPTTVTNNAKIHWDWTSLYILELQAIPNPGLSMTIMALDNTGKAIDGEEVTVFGNSIVRFRHANICAVGVRGSGEVKNFNGVTMNSFVNDPNWQLIEVVGLPVQVGEADPDAYDTEDLQGRSGSLRPGDDAARMRLQVGAILANTPPATTPGGTSTPTWPIANPDIVLNDEIRGGNPSLLEMILEMLQSLDPNQLGNAQSDFLRPVDTPGMQQPGGPASSEQATLELPVAGLVMLGAATDYWAALGYGFGTTDFPDFRETEGGSTPPGPMMSAHDYMITYMKRYPFGLELEVAAPASVVRLPVPAPHNFAASLWLQNRPIIRDSTGDHDVTLSWERPRKYAPPGGYALAIMTDPPGRGHRSRPMPAVQVERVRSLRQDRKPSSERRAMLEARGDG